MFKTMLAGACALVAIGSAATAAPVLTAGTDPTFAADFEVRYRSLANTGAEEVYLGVNVGDTAQRSAQQLTWGASQTFTFAYDSMTDLMSSTVGSNPTLTRSFAGDPTFNAFELYIFNRDRNRAGAGGVVSLSDVTVNGHLLGDFPTDDEFEAWTIAVDPTADFTITGTLNRTGVFSTSQERSKVEFKAGSVAPIPLPAAAWLLISGVAGLGFLGRRRRAA